MMRVLLRIALLLAPGEFRAEYGAQIDAATEGELRFGDVLDVAVTGVGLRIEEFARDLTYALRRLRAAPLFVGIVVVTFALGIGANVAVFSVLNAVVLKPLPFADPSRIVIVSGSSKGGTADWQNLALNDPLDMRGLSAFDGTAASTEDGGTMLAHGRPFAVAGFDVIPDYFGILGIDAELGRVLVPADGDPGVHNIVISDEIWRADFGTDPGVIGETVSLNGTAERIVGVLHPNQPSLSTGDGLKAQDFYAALPEGANPAERGMRFLDGIARLAPGATVESANAQLALLSARLRREFPKTDHGWTLSVASSRSVILGAASSVLWIIFIAVVGILLIACANVGNMLGARWSTRDRELAVRRALGASSRRIGMQLLVEAGLLAFIGAAAGVALAYTGLHVLADLLASAVPRASTIHIDAWSLLYAAGVVVAATFLAGMTPMLSLGNPDLQTVLKTAGRGGDASSRHRLRSSLLALEIALALALVVISGLTVRSFIDLVNTPLGIRPAGVVASDLTVLPEKNLGTLAERTAMQRDLLARLQALPGVKYAALTVLYPLGSVTMRSNLTILGRTYPPGTEPNASENSVTPDYFRVLGIPLERGRAFTAGDTANAAPVAIVNQAFVQNYLQGVDPLGVRIQSAGWNGTKTHWATIVGVVGDERDELTRPHDPEYFIPLAQAPAPYTSALVYAPGVDPAAIGREMQGAFAATMPTVTPPVTRTVAQLVAGRTGQERFATILLAALAFIALALALSGIYGVVSFSVTQRTREFGVRIAHGATARNILADVLRRTLKTTAVGVTIGLVIAALAARAIASQLGSVSPLDPATFLCVVSLVFLSAALASLYPAVRATRVQPVEALRYE
ncbi:MAG TPA: ABC transporter permease [Candidatus Acidoferrales bacterium]|nr:ABC transporter permease [Candidatus Acidoferrales bacterium]